MARSTPVANKKTVSIRLSSAEHQAVKVRAARKGITLSSYVQQALSSFSRRIRHEEKLAQYAVRVRSVDT